MFILSSDIQIGRFRFSGVHAVTISKSVHGIVQRAQIKIPSTARILNRSNGQPETVTTGKQFQVGDAVVIRLGYNETLNEEFTGFVTALGNEAPLVMECEGSSWLLNRNLVNGFYKRISLADLLQKAVSGLEKNYRIKTVCTADILFSNILLSNNTGADVLALINEYTDGVLTCYFISADTLQCGLAYTGDTQSATTAKYKLGFNTIRSNNLAIKNTAKAATAVVYSKRLSDGSVIVKSSENATKALTQSKKTLNHIASSASLKLLANEKAARINYRDFEGNITTLLQPHVSIGDRISLTDPRDNDHDGSCLVESTMVSYGIKGATRKVELGIKQKG